MGESIISGIVRVDYTESILIGFEPAYLFDLLIASVFCGVNRDIGVLYGFTGLGIDSEQFQAFSPALRTMVFMPDTVWFTVELPGFPSMSISTT